MSSDRIVLAGGKGATRTMQLKLATRDPGPLAQSAKNALAHRAWERPAAAAAQPGRADDRSQVASEQALTFTYALQLLCSWALEKWAVLDVQYLLMKTSTTMFSTATVSIVHCSPIQSWISSIINSHDRHLA